MLELDDIQHFLIERPRALVARYEFLTFRRPESGRAWLAGIIDKVGTAQAIQSASKTDMRWVTVAFTWNGLRVLGVDEAALATFPEEFRQGMEARAEILGDTGANHPDHWEGGLASPGLHAIVILFARDVAERERCVREHQTFLTQTPRVEVLSSLDLEALPPLDYAHDHFGYRDRISMVTIEGMGDEPTPGSGPPIKPGEFFLGYPDEEGPPYGLPLPEILSRNGSYLAYRRLQEHVGAFRDFLRQNGATPEEQELIAAKLMGRWRSGAPLVLAPEKDDPALAADPKRNNNFDYGKMDPHGYAVPLGAHIRRMNPRDTAVNMQRRRMIRRGGTYGPPLPEDVPDDGVDRGIAAFVGCASLIRQFEFAQNVWINDPKFHELGNERDPIIGTQDGTFDMTIPKRPIRKKIKGLPAFTTVKGGAYFFLPGMRALRFLAAGAPSARKKP
ncbi:MAG: Dyp-type peroxidase [Thermodesulfobacteriota bacterium]